MSAKIYKFPKTFDGRMVLIVGIMAGWDLEGRDWDAEARQKKSEFYANKAKAEQQKLMQDAAQAAAEEAAKVVPFKRASGR